MSMMPLSDKSTETHLCVDGQRRLFLVFVFISKEDRELSTFTTLGFVLRNCESSSLALSAVP
jgi:hypothetical protein